MGCTVYCYQKGSQYACTQEIVDKLYDSKSIGIKINVTESKKKDFSAVGQHNYNPIILRVDSDEEIYIKLNLEVLEAKYTAK